MIGEKRLHKCLFLVTKSFNEHNFLLFLDIYRRIMTRMTNDLIT